MASNNKGDENVMDDRGHITGEGTQNCDTFVGVPLPEYMKVAQLPKNGGIKINLDLGVVTEEGQRRLEEIIALMTKEISVGNIELMEIDGPKYLEWDKFSEQIVHLLLKRKIKVIAVPVQQVDRLQGLTSCLVMSNFKKTFMSAENIQVDGKLTIAGVDAPLRDVISPSVLTSRIVALQQESDDTLKVKLSMMQMREKNHVPKSLRPLLISLYKVARRNERFERSIMRKVAKEEKMARKRKSNRTSNTSASSVSDYSISDIESTGFDIDVLEDVREGNPHEATNDPRESSPKPGMSKYARKPKLNISSKCYICHQRSRTPKNPSPATQHYDCLCPPCAEINWNKRQARIPLEGYIAVVTGGRIKIGYGMVLKLLRDGCQVVTTTRFPHDASKRYVEEPDYDEWKDRLKIYPLELKDSKCIYQFIEYLKESLPYVSILINNAAQTIRRPFDFYKHLLEYEETPRGQLPDTQRHLMAATSGLTYRDVTSESMVATSQQTASSNLAITGSLSPDSKTAMRSSLKRKSDQLQSRSVDVTSDVKKRKFDNLPGAGENTPEGWSHVVNRKSDGDFPVGCLDEHGQQLDLRLNNSWTAVLEEVPISELLEVLMINTIAPYILNKELKDLMKASPHKRRFIVNVSAMEGQFHRASKTKFHPHTNMAKAALNMMTRTGALSYQHDGIYMTSVDTGWVTDERPFSVAVAESKKGFIVPLDTVDGAARVYDPIVMGLSKDKEPYYAVFLKNYHPHPW